jgi:hypothetical protein
MIPMQHERFVILGEPRGTPQKLALICDIASAAADERKAS